MSDTKKERLRQLESEASEIRKDLGLSSSSSLESIDEKLGSISSMMKNKQWTKEEILNIKDSDERQRLMYENKELFLRGRK